MAAGIIRLDEGWAFDAGHRMDQPPNVPVLMAVARPRPAKHNAMDFIPNKRADQYLWWKNLRDQIDVEGPKMGLSAAATAAKAIAIDQVGKLEATDAARAALDGARAVEAAATATNEGAIRASVRNWKTLPAYTTSGSEGVLRLRSNQPDFDPNTFKPVLKISIVGGQIKVEFIKSECDSVAVYCRQRGAAAWTKLGTDSGSPYYDTNPLANPAVPEVREYMARGVIDDAEIGLPSDIVSITLS